MRGLVGVWHLDQRPAGALVWRMLGTHGGAAPRARWLWHDGAIGLGIVPFSPEPPDTARKGVVRDGRYVLAADARIDNRDAVTRSLGLRTTPSDAQLLLEAYARWGADCVDHLVGVFAFAVWDLEERLLFCARDPVGVRPFYYAFQSQRLFAWASELSPLLNVDGLPRRINEVRVADFLARRADDAAATFYEGILRLPPGHTLTLRSDREPVLRRYWEFGGRDPSPIASDAECEEGFRNVFEEAVRCRLPQGDVGVLLSGGLDSSSVTGVAAQVHRQPVHGFSATFLDLPDDLLRLSDERSYVASVVRSTGIVSHLVPVSGDGPADDLDRYAEYLQQPPFVSNLYLIDRLHRAAHDKGVRVLLDGCEGDDAVSHGVERFWELGYHGEWGTLRAEAEALASRTGGRPADIFTRYGRRGALMRARTQPLRFLTEASAVATLSGRSSSRVLSDYWLKPRLRALLRRPSAPPPAPPALLRSDFVGRIGYEARLEEYAVRGRSDILSARELHRLVLAAGVGAIATVLEETAHLASMAGVERRHPFYDVRVLNYCLSLPPDQKLRDGWTRSILRRSLRDVLPDEVRLRTDKADLSPHFGRSLLRKSRPRLDRLLSEDWPLIEPYVDRAALESVRERDDSTTLWTVLVLAESIRRSRYAPEVPVARADTSS